MDVENRPSELVGMVTNLGREPLTDNEGRLHRYSVSPAGREDSTKFTEELITFIDRLADPVVERGHRVLGCGISVSGHVDQGVVRISYSAGWGGPKAEDAFPLEEQLVSLPFGVALDNDITSLALHQNISGRPRESYAVVAVLPEGVGGGLVIHGGTWRGSQGMAGEIGHITTRIGKRACHRCGKEGCVEAYATPYALLDQAKPLGITDLEELASRPSTEESIVKLFRSGGRALGQGLEPLINWVNPASIYIYLPPSLSMENRFLAGHAYREEVESEIQHSFSTGARTRLFYEVKSGAEMDALGVRAAASLVLGRLIDHVEKQQDPKSLLRRPN
ncbi:ROK family protein [Streptomyces sp. NPDC059720]|uniref:ROK family protein n=1 Tax=Streptomyces sp. NPDC059720 TaxID=3346924 RepID=UPI003682DF44